MHTSDHTARATPLSGRRGNGPFPDGNRVLSRTLQRQARLHPKGLNLPELLQLRPAQLRQGEQIPMATRSRKTLDGTTCNAILATGLPRRPPPRTNKPLNRGSPCMGSSLIYPIQNTSKLPPTFARYRRKP